MPRLNFMPGLFHDGEGTDQGAKTQKTVVLGGRVIPYELERKQVKNINLRIRPDGSVHVSASRRHTSKQIEALFTANEQMILRSLDKAELLREKASSIKQVSRAAEGKLCEAVISGFCRKYYPSFAAACKGCMPENAKSNMGEIWEVISG